MLVIPDQATLVSGIYLCCLVVRLSPSPLSCDMSAPPSHGREIVNSLLQLEELSAITRVFVTSTRRSDYNLPSGWMLQS